MKSLTESLFDADLISQKLQYEDLVDQIKSHKSLIHIVIPLFAPLIKRIDSNQLKSYIKHQLRGSDKYIDLYVTLSKWLEEFIDKRKETNIIAMPITARDRKEYKNMGPIYDAVQWLKFGEIHTTTYFNDRMYASELDVPQDMLNNASKWIFWKDGSDVICMTNQDNFEYWDKMIIDALIDNVVKYYKKGTF